MMKWLTDSAAGVSGRGSCNLGVSRELFAGPSIIGVPASLLATFDKISGPIAAGDLDRRLAQPVKPTVICIADGYLEPDLAIPNDEIRRVLSAGWTVWGVSSVGALKAVELASEGMKGFGLVYRLLRRFHNVTAKDISVLHFPFPPYEPETISLLEIYILMRVIRKSGLLTKNEKTEILENLRSMPPCDRTYDNVQKCTPQRLVQILDAIYATPMEWRIKRRDLAWLCNRKPWEDNTDLDRITRGEAR